MNTKDDAVAAVAPELNTNGVIEQLAGVFPVAPNMKGAAAVEVVVDNSATAGAMVIVNCKVGLTTGGTT